MPMRSFRSTDSTDRQLEVLCAAGFGNATQVILTAIDRMFQQEITTVITATIHKYNLSSNMAHRINFDQMVERRLCDVQSAYGDEVGDWHLYFDLAELDVDDEAEAAARIESLWPVVKAMYTVQWEAQTGNGFQSDVVGKYDSVKHAINVAKAFAYGGTRRDGDLVWEDEGVDEDTIVYVTDPNGDTIWTSEGVHAETEVEIKEEV